MARRHPLAALRRFGIVLMLMPFVLLSLMAQGVMPQATPGGMRLVLCTGEGMVEIVLAPGGAPLEEEKHSACDWATGHGASDLPGMTAELAPFATQARALDPIAPASWRESPRPQGPLARGPPATV